MEMLERTSYLDELSGLLRQVVRHLMILGAATAIASRTSTTARRKSRPSCSQARSTTLAHKGQLAILAAPWCHRTQRPSRPRER
jgi:hypothetical protein